MDVIKVDLTEAMSLEGICDMTLIDHDLHDGPPKAYKTTCGLLFSQELVEQARAEGLRATGVSPLIEAHRKHHADGHPPYRVGWGSLLSRLHNDSLDGEWVEVECHH